MYKDAVMNLDNPVKRRFMGMKKARLAAVFLCAALLLPAIGLAAEPVVVVFTQTPCKIVEVEKNSREYTSKSYDDCVRINKETAGERTFKTLRLKPGRTIFRVTNSNVPYDLGFWVRGKGIGRVTLPTVSGGGLSTGKTLDYVIDLKPGEYLYSCPLNPTPNYPLIVE
jgi:hypothetical protein